MAEKEWKALKKKFWMRDYIILTDNGPVDFSPDRYRDVDFNGVRVSYEEFLDLQRVFGGADRTCFAKLFVDCGGSGEFKGQIERVNEKSGKVLFTRIFVQSIYGDGSYWTGKEDHVWMSRTGLEAFCAGDRLSFSADVYRYIKKGNGKQIEFGIRNPRYIKKIAEYELPSDDEMLMQEIGDFVCETCMYTDYCYRDPCIAPPGYREDIKRDLFALYRELRMLNDPEE